MNQMDNRSEMEEDFTFKMAYVQEQQNIQL
jgi:hypothetical protein